MKKTNFLLFFLFVLLLVRIHFLTPIIGQNTPPPSDPCEYCKEVFPSGQFFERSEDPPFHKIFSGSPSGPPQLIGYVFRTIELAPYIKGFAGPIDIVVAMDTQGRLIGIKVLKHSETPAYIGDLNLFVKQFVSWEITKPIVLDQTVDGISGATMTSQAITQAIQESLTVLNKTIKISKTTDLDRRDSLPPLRTVTPSEKPLNIEKIKSELSNTGLTPQDAKYWRALNL